MTQQANESATDAFDLDFDVSSVTDGMPEGFNDVTREEATPEFDTSSATDGLVDDGEVEHGSDSDLFPPAESIMQSVGDSAVTDLTVSEKPAATKKTAKKPSTKAGKASPRASDDSDAPEGDGDDK